MPPKPPKPSGRQILWTLFINWVGIYILVTGMLYLFRAMDLGLPMPVQTLILTFILVPIMGLVVTPFAMRTAARLSAGN